MFWHRKYPRLSKDFRVAYQLIDKEQFKNDPISSFVLNISGGGVCFETQEPLQKNAMLALSIHSNDFRIPILALVKVVWCKPKGETYTIGAEFWWVGWRDHETQSAIANYVANQTLCIASSEAVDGDALLPRT
jgi:hypothetical protein